MPSILCCRHSGFDVQCYAFATIVLRVTDAGLGEGCEGGAIAVAAPQLDPLEGPENPGLSTATDRQLMMPPKGAAGLVDRRSDLLLRILKGDFES